MQTIGVSTSRSRTHGRTEQTHPAFNVLLSAPEAVLQQRIQNAAETKRRFNDVRCKLADWTQLGQMTLHPEKVCM